MLIIHQIWRGKAPLMPAAGSFLMNNIRYCGAKLLLVLRTAFLANNYTKCYPTMDHAYMIRGTHARDTVTMPARPHCSGLRSSPSLYYGPARPIIYRYAKLKLCSASSITLRSKLLASFKNTLPSLMFPPWGGEIRAVAFQDRAP